MRPSLGTLMVIVGLAAIDMAVVRAFWGSRQNVLGGIALTGLMLNGGLFWLIRARGRARAFWAGFLLLGLLAAGSFAWAMTYPKVSATFVDQRTAMKVTIHSSGAPLSDQWDSYLDFVEESIGNLPDDWNPFSKGQLVEVLADASIAFAPQLIVALLGGLLFWLMAVVSRARLCAVLRRPPGVVASRYENVVQ
jgi:hypothetical protein